jgi:hypothetical protein
MMRNFSRSVAIAPFSSRDPSFSLSKKKGERSQAKLSSETKVDFALLGQSAQMRGDQHKVL